MAAAPSISAGPRSLPDAPGWEILHAAVVDSTNDRAAALPAWSCLVADRQRAGRGRTGRAWVSDPGGLWCSAVVPTPAPASVWTALPLVAGLAVIQAVAALGVQGQRLRWPNDIMIGNRKLAGILVERFHDDRVVIGMGLNISNDPAREDPTLSGIPIRLVDLLRTPPVRDRLLAAILGQLRTLHGRFQVGGLAAIIAELNTLWGEPREVVLDTHDGTRSGRFAGIDLTGSLLLTGADGTTAVLPPTEVRLLRET